MIILTSHLKILNLRQPSAPSVSRYVFYTKIIQNFIAVNAKDEKENLREWFVKYNSYSHFGYVNSLGARTIKHSNIWTTYWRPVSSSCLKKGSVTLASNTKSCTSSLSPYKRNDHKKLFTLLYFILQIEGGRWN
jgi:hypothetical protein